MGDIDKLKKQINLLRQQKALYQSNLQGLENDIESSQNTSKMSQNMMLNLKMKNEEDKTNYYRELNRLNR